MVRGAASREEKKAGDALLKSSENLFYFVDAPLDGQVIH